MSARRIAVFSGTRADYGLLRPVLFALDSAADSELLLMASGSHLSCAHGGTIAEIHADGFTIRAEIDLGLKDAADGPVADAMAAALTGVGSALNTLHPDLLVVLGDRYETFCAATAAQLARVPLAHIHGGETTEGAVDESFRHSITKMSHLHFASCEAHRKRIIQLGEAPERVWNVGALGVENAVTLDLPQESSIRAVLGFEANREYILCTLHPETLSAVSPEEHCTALLDALESFPEYCLVFTGANADPGGPALNAVLKNYVEQNKERCRFFMSLGVRRYLAAAKYAACVVGNSSSGIIEAPSLGTPVVDIGDRQRGRIRADSVLHSAPEKESLAQTIERALHPRFRAFARDVQNPYEKKGTARRIADRLRSHPLEGILHKTFFDIAHYF